MLINVLINVFISILVSKTNILIVNCLTVILTALYCLNNRIIALSLC